MNSQVAFWLRILEKHVVAERTFIFGTAIRNETDEVRAFGKTCLWLLMEFENWILRHVRKYRFLIRYILNGWHGFWFVIGAADGNADDILSLRRQNFRRKKLVVFY